MSKPPAPRGRPRKARPNGLRGELAERIEKLRKVRDYGQEEFAKAAGVALATVARLERGNVSPTLDTVVSVAHALGLSAAALLDKLPAWKEKPVKN